MRLPSALRYLPKQRYDRRFFRTADMFEVLALHCGVWKESCPRTWQYRTLIQLHRMQNSHSSYGKGYGLDWKCLVKVRDQAGNWTGQWKRDTGFAVKDDVLEYARKGKLPLRALQLAAEVLRSMERRFYVLKRIEELKEKHQPFRQAAE